MTKALKRRYEDDTNMNTVQISCVNVTCTDLDSNRIQWQLPV
jgi:hypothetical protein